MLQPLRKYEGAIKEVWRNWSPFYLLPNPKPNSIKKQFLTTCSCSMIPSATLLQKLFQPVFAVALTVEITGLLLSLFVIRGIAKGLNEINRVAGIIAKGDLSEKWF